MSILEESKKYAEAVGLEVVCPDVLMGAVLKSGLTVSLIFNAFNIDLKSLKVVSALHLSTKKQKANEYGTVLSMVKDAERIATEYDMEDAKDNVEFLMLAMARSEKPPYLFQFLEEEHSGFLSSLEEVVEAFIDDRDIDGLTFFEELEEEEELDRDNFQEPMESNEILEEFATNLNIKARDGEFDGLVAYDNTLDRLYTTLCRGKKRNAILTGKAGVGKTSMVEILAREIVNGTAPDLLSDKVIYDVHLSDMISGAIWRGQFEKRLCRFIEEAKSKKNVILFFDEIHTLVGAGSSGKTDDLEASNILKPALARGEISCIGATTPNEYDSKVKPDEALVRRFQQVHMYPPNSTQMKDILGHVVEYYEKLHPVKYTDEFVDSVIGFCDRELPNKSYPDKLADVIDFCGARAKMNFFVVPKNIRDLEKHIIAESMEGVEDLEDEIEELGDKYKEWNLSMRDSKAPVKLEHLNYYLREHSLTLLSPELQTEFCERLKDKVINVNNIEDFNKALYTINFKNNKSPNILLVYGDKKVGKSYFLKSVGECLRNCGAEVITLTKFGLNPQSILGEKNSLAKKLAHHESPVVIMDDCDFIDKKAADILSDGLKTGEFETVDGDIVDISNVTFILSSGVSQLKLGFDSKNKPIPNLSKDVLELAETIYLSSPSEEDKSNYLNFKVERLKSDLKRQGLVPRNINNIPKIIGDVESYEDVNIKFKERVLPKAIDTLKKSGKVVDFSK